MLKLYRGILFCSNMLKVYKSKQKGGQSMLQESNRIEFKVELNDKLEKEVVAFLNNKEGGILYVGVDDNGKPVRISDIDSTQLKIADRIKNNILPSTLGLFDIVTEEIDNISVIKILISSGLGKTILYKETGNVTKWLLYKNGGIISTDVNCND